MKVAIKSVVFKREWKSDKGTFYDFEVKYQDQGGNDKVAYYTGKSKDQPKIVPSAECEVQIEEKQGKNGIYFKIKPVDQRAGFNRVPQKESAKYPSFAVSYAKDLAVAGKLGNKNITETARELFNLLLELENQLP